MRYNRGNSCFLLALALILSQAALTHGRQEPDVKPPVISPSEAKRVIATRANQVISALKARDLAKFSTFVHPRKGVRFSPYASVLPNEDRLIHRKQLLPIWASNKRYLWGSYDGSGDPIRVTFKRYFREFVFDRDYSRAKTVRYNQVMSHGNTPNTIRETYPDSIAVEYFISGVDPRRDGMDWSSLWLVFEKNAGRWFLVGIVHDEWTI